MSKLKKIIVGHDLRVGGNVALKSAAVLARRCGAALRVVHVVEAPHFYERVAHPLDFRLYLQAIAEKAGARLQALVASPELAHLQVGYEVRDGKPFAELIIAGRAWLADLIVVGGAARREKHFLGSTGERVVRKALVPVMVAKKPLSAAAKTFLVATDFSSCAKKAAEEALALAKSFRSRVVFFHVLEPYPLYAYAYEDEVGVSLPIPPPTPEEIEKEWQSFLAGLALADIEWEKYVEEGHAANAIVGQAERIQADLIVTGTHGRTGLPHMLLGSVAEVVARKAPCPVLTVRPEAFQFEMP